MITETNRNKSIHSSRDGAEPSSLLGLLLAGGLAASYGLWRRDWQGGLLAAGGAYLLYRAAAAPHSTQSSCLVAQTIGKPVSEVYRFIRDPQNFSGFMPWIQSVREIESNIYECTLVSQNHSMPSQIKLLEDMAERSIRWRLIASEYACECRLDFSPAPGDRGTEVRAAMDCSMSESLINQMLKLTLGESIEQRTREALRAVKEWMEAGEIPTIQNQPSGARGLTGKIERKLFRETPENRPTSFIPLQQRTA